MISDSSPEIERAQLSHMYHTPAKMQLTGTRTTINYTTILSPMCNLGINIKRHIVYLVNEKYNMLLGSQSRKETEKAYVSHFLKSLIGRRDKRLNIC